MTISVGCIIITVLSYVVSVFGFALIHTFEKYSWVVAFVLLCVLIGQSAPHVDMDVPALDTGLGLAGSFLSFLFLCFSSSSGWCSIAADYYCNYPAKTPEWKVFMLTLWGVTIPTIFVTIIGACIGNAALSAEYPPYALAYSGSEDGTIEGHGLGGLLLVAFHPSGFSKFALVMLMFSVLGNNIAIFYSNGLSIQLLGHYFHAIPRFIWSFLVAVVIGALAIAGKDSLSAVVSNFVSLLGYWTISFTLILLIEDKWFRRNDGYDLTVWDTPKGLPWGAAAVFALLAGYLGGGVPGMAQVWYIGPIAEKFGPFGGDVGVIMSGAITLLVYPIARTIEKKKSGK
jgi:purine-cytosine permease-like protein